MPRDQREGSRNWKRKAGRRVVSRRPANRDIHAAARGGDDVSASPDDIALIKRQVETQLDEYAQAIEDYAAFMANWRARQQQAAE